MNARRQALLQKVAFQRQLDLTVILENVDDVHNIGAVMRSCDAVGIREIFIVYTDPERQREKLKLGKRTSAGVRRWLKVHLYTDLESCFEHVRSKYQQVFSTHLSQDAQSLYDLDLNGSVALVFGNEHKGISEAALALSDCNFIIPQVGMAKSLNVSVACAVSLYEVYRQRAAKGIYEKNLSDPSTEHKALFEHFIEIHEGSKKGHYVKKKE